MLFSYEFVPHQMDKMQTYLDFTFYEVCSKAKGKDYDIDVLFDGNEELRTLITELHASENKGADFFLTGLQRVFEDFKKLSDDELERLKSWYRSNNDIEGLCVGQDGLEPATYDDVEIVSKDLSEHLKSFYKNLYSQAFLSLKSVKDRIGEIDNHYHDFVSTNRNAKCPFCGIGDTLGQYHSVREAYDHYLPKKEYPFNSINFHNLVPTCHTCNSGYKTTKNTLFTQAGARRKAFYPYSRQQYSIELTITLNTVDWTRLDPSEIELHTGPEALQEEIETWLDVYGIEERYRAKCCGEQDGKGWIREIVDESQNVEQLTGVAVTPKQYLQMTLKTMANQPWTDSNFLRKPFLEACDGQGIFS